VKEGASRRPRGVGWQVMMILRMDRLWFPVRELISFDLAVRGLGTSNEWIDWSCCRRVGMELWPQGWKAG